MPLGHSFYLPLTGERSVTSDSASQPVEGSSACLSRQTILVVDDEDTLRYVIRRLLEDAGYGVVEAANGLQALGQLNDPRAVIHVVLSDIRMPVMDGWELTAAIVRSHPTLPVILMSGFGTTFLESSVHPRVNFLPKPFAHERLLNLLRQVLSSDPRST
jgi:two-component system cell cycle sensor histidine kinase/response regulator CckA